MARSLPNALYHYTSTDGLIGILRSQSLWATDIEYLNDSEELTHASAELGPRLETRIQELGGEDVERNRNDPRSSQIMVLRELRAYVESVQKHESDERAYVTCFCEDGDLLSQWRGYAGPGGFALGFNPLLLDPLRSDVLFHPILTWVRYGANQARLSFDSWVAELAPHATNHPGTTAWHQQILVLRMLASVKNPGFKEEQEWRTIVSSHLNRSRYGSAAFPPEHASFDLLFRSGPVGLVPYVARPFNPDAVVSVTVGPGANQTLRKRAVSQLLEETLGRERSASISVHMSQVPLR